MISHTFVHTCKCSYWARVTYTCPGERQRGFRRDGGHASQPSSLSRPTLHGNFTPSYAPQPGAASCLTVLQREGRGGHVVSVEPRDCPLDSLQGGTAPTITRTAPAIITSGRPLSILARSCCFLC